MNNELTISATADRLGVLLRLSRERTIRYNFRPEILKQLKAIERAYRSGEKAKFEVR